MSVACFGDFEKKRIRRRFRPAKAGTPLSPAVLRERFTALLPASLLRELASESGALDVRERKLPCLVFFWAMTIALVSQGPVWLSTIAAQVGAAALMASLEGRHVSRQAVSENLCRRPWGFFAAVLKYLLAGQAAASAGPVAGLEVIRQLDVLLVDTTMLRLARRLAAVFPTYATARSPRWVGAQLHSRMEVQSSLPEVVTLTSVKEDELSVSFLQEVGRAALYIFDLGYWCYALFDEIIDRQQHFLSRLKGKSNPLIKEVYVGEQPWVGCRWQEIDLGERREVDLLVNLTAANVTAKTRRKPRTPAERKKDKGHRRAKYMEHDVRLVGEWQESRQRWFFYVTSLLDRQAFPVSLIVDLYRVRWQIEILFRNLKYVLGLNHLISSSENGVYIQIYAAMICYLLTRLVIRQAAVETGRPEEDFSVPYCVQIVGQLVAKVDPLALASASNAELQLLESRLVAAIIAQGLRPNRRRRALLTSVKKRLAQPQTSLS